MSLFNWKCNQSLFADDHNITFSLELIYKLEKVAYKVTVKNNESSKQKVSKHVYIYIYIYIKRERERGRERERENKRETDRKREKYLLNLL